MTRKSRRPCRTPIKLRLRPSVRALQCRWAMMRTTPAPLAALALSWALVACGSDGEPSDPSAGFSVDFSLSKGGTSLLACRDVPDVNRVRVRVLASDGFSPLLGWPQDADCATGRFTNTTLPAGSYVLEVTAQGDLFDDPEALLFKARRPFTLPADRAMEISLAPEVAFLEVTWSFATGDLTPCSEIESLSLSIGTGAAGTGSYNENGIDCTAGRFAVPTPLLPQNLSLSMRARSKISGSTLYTVAEDRLLERGQNPPFAVVFRPLGGELLFDWAFMVGAATITPCDDSRVGVSSLVARVIDAMGEDLEADIPCAGQRPVRFPGERFTQGRVLTLELSAEGVQRFKVAREFTTAVGDTDLGLLTLPAVGSATVAVSRSPGSSCPATVSRLTVSATPIGGGEAVSLGELPAEGGSLLVRDVPLGEYTVQVAGRIGASMGPPPCEVSGPRTIDGRTNRWEPFEL